MAAPMSALRRAPGLLVMALIAFDTSELDDLIELLNRRADRMVPDAVDEGTEWANSHPGQRQDRIIEARGRRIVRFSAASRGRRVVTSRPATGSEKAHSIEHVMYHRFLDFFGSW